MPGLFLSLVAHAQESAPLPTAPGEMIQNLYTYLLFVSGFLAVGAIVWGSIVYVSAAGNPGKQKDGREWIEEALKGLLLLFAAALLLRTVNPELLNLNLLQFAGLKDTTSVASPAEAWNGECAGGPCASIADLGIPCKNGCMAAAATVQALGCMQERARGIPITFTVTEAMPPSSHHGDPTHSNGCAADVRIDSPRTGVCPAVESLMAVARQCGMEVTWNEYIRAGCPGAHPGGTGDHIHFEACQ